MAIIVLGAVFAYVFYYQNNQISSQSNQISSQAGQISTLESEIASLSAGASTIQGQLSQLQGSQSTTNSEVSSIQGSLHSLQSQLSTIQGELQTEVNTNYQTLNSEIQNMNTTLQALATKLSTLFPQVPQSALTIVGSNYDNSSAVYTFTVHNSQAYSIYAQLSASFYGNPCNFYAGEGSYMSQVLSFGPNATLTIPVDFKGVAFSASSFCGKEPVAYFTMDFVASSTTLSQSYTFQVNPPYQF